MEVKRRFNFKHKLGKGAFGNVFLAEDLQQKRTVAIKVIRLERCKGRIEDFQREVGVLATVQSPYITQYYGSYVVKSRIWLVMEFVGGGSVGDVIKTQHALPEEAVAVILHYCLEALVYLHSHDQPHRDIKPANMLLTQTGECKLCDLGIAGELTKAKGRKSKQRNCKC